MLNATANMSALEWFFRKPPPSKNFNFPQDTSSPELRQLSNAAERLSIALSSHGPTPELAKFPEHAPAIAEWVGKVKASEKIDRADIDTLVLKVGEVIKIVRNSNKPSGIENIYESLNATVIAFVILAKTSQDIEFRNEIVRLAKSFASC